MIFVGVDGAEAYQGVMVQDEAGKRLAGGRLRERVDGIARFHELVGDQFDKPSGVVVGIETDRACRNSSWALSTALGASGTPGWWAPWAKTRKRVYSAVKATGRWIPNDVAVVSCDDTPSAPFLPPPLTSVPIPFAETGARAVEVLVDRINGGEVTTETSLLPVELVVQGSCGAARPLSPSGTGANSAQKSKEKL